MTGNIKATVTCPYCGLQLAYPIAGRWTVVECDVMEGGCDKPFAIWSSMRIVATTHTIGQLGKAQGND